MNQLRRWLEEKAFWFRTGGTIDLKIANNGNPVNLVVIRHGDLYFEIMIDAATGDPTGDFGWFRNRMISHSPLRDDWRTVKGAYCSTGCRTSKCLKAQS